MSSRKRGQSLLEILYPDAPAELVQTAKAWVADSYSIILDAIWRAFDSLQGNPALKAALELATDDLERGLTRLLYFALNDALTGEEPFRLLPEAPEDESRKRPPARPPAYDIAFAMRVNPRIMWSLEAKILRTDTSLGDYVATLKDRFLSCNYAPFVSEGAMAGYLMHGLAENAFQGISERLAVRLNRPRPWKEKHHRTSIHSRSVPPGKPYPIRFRCHHLMIEFSQK